MSQSAFRSSDSVNRLGAAGQSAITRKRTGKSYDYLMGENDDQRARPSNAFSYHDPTGPSKRGKSYDYLDEDQNVPDDQPPQRRPRQVQKYSHFSESDSEEDEWLDHQIRMQQLLLEQAQTLCKPRKQANPGPIGLLGFGMTTVLLNIHNTGEFPLYSVVPAMGICFGGGAQLIAGLLEFTKGNTFACVAFTSYGAFWLSLVCVWMLPNSNWNGPASVVPTSHYFLGAYLAIWGVFSFVMMCCTFRMNVAICLVFVTVTLLFFLLAGGNMTDNATALRAAGYEGIVCGALALYLGFAEIINEVWDRTLLPIVPMTQVWASFGRKAVEEKEKKNE